MKATRVAIAALLVAASAGGCGGETRKSHALRTDRAIAHAGLLRISDLPRDPWKAFPPRKVISGCRTTVPRRVIRLRAFSPVYEADGSGALSVIIVYATAGSAEAALEQISSSAFRRCYVRHLLQYRNPRFEILSVAQHTVPAFRPLGDSTASRYILRSTARGAVFFQVEDVFYFRVRRFLCALILGTANRFPKVAAEETILQKLRARMILDSR